MDAGVITPETRLFLESLSPTDEDQVVSLYHASPRDPVWEYVLSPLQAELAFEVQPERISVSDTRTSRSPSTGSMVSRPRGRPDTTGTSLTSTPGSGC